MANKNMSDSVVAIMAILAECTVDQKRLEVEIIQLKKRNAVLEEKLKKKKR